MRIIRPLVRKTTKIVTYGMPVVPISKSLLMGTRRGNQGRAEIKKQSGLMEQQNQLLAQQIEQSQRQADRMIEVSGHTGDQVI